MKKISLFPEISQFIYRISNTRPLDKQRKNFQCAQKWKIFNHKSINLHLNSVQMVNIHTREFMARSDITIGVIINT